MALVMAAIYSTLSLTIVHGNTRSIETGRDFCGLDVGRRFVDVNGLSVEVDIEYELNPREVLVSLDLMGAGERWGYVDEHTQHVQIKLIDSIEMDFLRALHPLAHGFVLETDLYIWMQQDDSVNPSAIYAVLIPDMKGVNYTFADRTAGNTVLVISDDKRHLRCQSSSPSSDLCGSDELGLPEKDSLTSEILFQGANFRPLDGTQKNGQTERSKYSWTATYYRAKWKMAECDWLETTPATCSDCMEPLQNIDALLDYNATSCISLFTSGRKTCDLAFKVHSQQPRGHAALNVVTNIACREPNTLVVAQSSACNGDDASNAKFKQCALDSDVSNADADDLSRCRFVCTCIGPCETIIIQHHVLQWEGENPEEYRVCNVDAT